MAFGWFSGKKAPAEKALEKAGKLAGQGRWAEALTYYEEGLQAQPDSEAARAGARACRERLVESNLAEARGYATAEEPAKAREHAQLAIELAGGEEDLRRRAQDALEELGTLPPPAADPAPGRLFPPSCSCAAPCDDGNAEEASDAGAELEDLFAFYLESLSAEERGAFETLGGTFPEGFVHLQQGEVEAARPLLTEAGGEHPDAPGPHYALGLLAALDNDPAAAGSHFARALEADPDFAPAAHHRADVLREGGNPEDGATFLRGWLETHPEDAEAWVLLAACLLLAGDPAAALAASTEAAQRGRMEDPRPNLFKARSLRLLGQPDQALGAFQAVAARRPDLLEALVPMGQILLEKGGPSAERAVEVFKRCYRLDPERGWWHLLRVAEAYKARGWVAEARDVLAQAQEQLPDTDEARGQWEEASRSLS